MGGQGSGYETLLTGQKRGRLLDKEAWHKETPKGHTLCGKSLKNSSLLVAPSTAVHVLPTSIPPWSSDPAVKLILSLILWALGLWPTGGI